MNRGEVWWVRFDPAVGGEIRKSRPAVIISTRAKQCPFNVLLAVCNLADRVLFDAAP